MVASRIKELREQEGLSQGELARIMGISRTAVSEIEAGTRKVSSEELVRIARAFSVTVDYLLGLEDRPQVTFDLESEGVAALAVREGPTSVYQEERIRINVPQRNLEKFREVLLYILNKVGAKPNIGETVIYKLLYFIDFDYYEKYEEQFIGATYQKNHYGPTPLEFQDIVQRMITDGDIVKLSKKYFDYDQKRYLPRRAPALDKLSAREIVLVDDVLGRLSDMNAAQISAYSHQDVPWQTTDDGEVIDYEAVFYRTVQYSVRSYGDDGVS